MSLIVDAYNVLHCTHVLPEPYAMISARGLCQLLDRTNFDANDMAVVCDGRPKPSEDPAVDVGRVELVYSGPKTDADSIIEQRIERHPTPRELVVVSNDNRIRVEAQRFGARPLSAERFLKRLMRRIERAAQTPPPAEKPSTADPELWMRRFGLNGKGTAPDDAAAEADADRWMREFGYYPDEQD